jgi:hypothetical protein
MEFFKKHMWWIIAALVIAAYMEYKNRFWSAHINAIFGTKFNLPTSTSATGATVNPPA